MSTKSTQANSFPCEKWVTIISRPKIGPLPPPRFQRPVLPSLGLPAARMLHMCHKWLVVVVVVVSYDDYPCPIFFHVSPTSFLSIGIPFFSSLSMQCTLIIISHPFCVHACMHACLYLSIHPFYKKNSSIQ